MADIVKLRTGYAVKVSVLRVGFAGPAGADGSAYDDTAILARVADVEDAIGELEEDVAELSAANTGMIWSTTNW